MNTKFNAAEYNKQWAKDNSDHVKAYQARYREEHRDKHRAYFKAHYQANKQDALEKGKIYYEQNRQRIILRNNEWLRNHPEQAKAYKAKWKKGPTEAALRRRIADSLRSRVRKLLRGGYKSAPTLKLLGCSVENFKIYLESKFESGMSWENYGVGFGKWNIDHIMPCAIFDLTREAHQQRCFHFSNMQPMWFEENMAKGAKL